jgi:DNA modification methylase
MSDRVVLGHCELWCGMAEEVLPTLPDASAQLILVDPPYYNVKNDYLGEKITWDRQWPDREAYLAWLRQLAKEWQRVLAPNGSLYCFASPQLSAYVEVMLGELFAVLQRITWRKPRFATKAEMFDKDSMRRFFPSSEDIIFAEQHSEADARNSSAYEQAERALKKRLFGDPIQAAMQRAGVTRRELATLFPSVTGGMTGCVSNWLLGDNIPTHAQYTAIWAYLSERQGTGGTAPQPYATVHVEYDDRRHGYDDLRQEFERLRRYFHVTPDVPYTNVWDFYTVPTGKGKHPCEKPLGLLRHIINVSSRPGDLVLDCCMGSGSTLEAAYQCGRRAIGIDQDRHWWTLAQSRLSQLDLFARLPSPDEEPPWSNS